MSKTEIALTALSGLALAVFLVSIPLWIRGYGFPFERGADAANIYVTHALAFVIGSLIRVLVVNNR